MLNILKINCRYFNNDRPCFYHKQLGVMCDTCSYFSPVDFKILIIKLDAMGDVLRTTCILRGLKEKYPNSHISWITLNESIPLLENSLFIDALWNMDDANLVLQTEEYYLIINPETSPTSARLATIAKGKKKLGFGYHKRGYVYPFNKEAEQWFALGINDNLKKANTRTYQRLIMDICQLDPSSYEIVYRLTNEEKEFAEDFARRHGLKLKSTNHIVGLNTGAGSRWPQKKWTEKGYLSLIRLLRKNIKDVTILLYGGTEERERNKTIKKIANTESVINTGHDHSIRKFGALLSIPEIIVTGDTLAMHIAIALEKKMVVLFGPTSNAEIDLYGRGEKIYPEMDCLVCYKQFCDKNPTCMESITPESVYQAIIKMLP